MLPPDRKRGWVFTINNPAEDKPFKDRWNLTTTGASYLVYGVEYAPTTGTKHLQGFIYFENARTFSSVKNILTHNPHLEGVFDIASTILYTKKGPHCQWDSALKDESPFYGMEAVVYEFGTPPKTAKQKGEQEKARWDNILSCAKQGRFSEIDSKTQIVYCRQLEYVFTKNLAKQRVDPESVCKKHIWLYGDTGTGKSYAARTKYPDAYLKTCNKWWDNYLGQDVVIMDEFSPVHNVLGYHLKLWADVWEFACEGKGVQFPRIRPKLLVVTSNYHPKDIWMDPNDLDPILRRFTLYHFTTEQRPLVLWPIIKNTASLLNDEPTDVVDLSSTDNEVEVVVPSLPDMVSSQDSLTHPFPWEEDDEVQIV